jgi:drug/metabolite transporter (DMT)-like permease
LDRERLKGGALALGGMLAISTDSLLTRLAEADGFDVTFWIGVIAACVILGGVTAGRRTTPVALIRRDGWPLLASAALQATSTTCFVMAVKATSVANVVVIVAAAPLAAAAIGWLWLRERPSRRVWLAMAASAVGIVVVVSGSFGGGNPAGDLLAVGAITAFGLGIVLLRRHPDISRTMVVGLAGIGMAVFAAWPATIFGHSLRTWLAVLAMGAVFGPVARVMLATATRYLPAAEVGLFAPVETVFASLWVFLVFGEVPSGATWIGGAIVLTALLWGIWPRRRARTLSGARPRAAADPGAAA